MKRRALLLCAIVLVVASAASGYTFFLAAWSTPFTTVHYGLLGAYQSAFVSAAGEWTSRTSFTYQTSPSSRGACSTTGALLNGAEFFDRDCGGSPLGATTLAVTECQSLGGTLIACGITFKSSVSWGLYNGPAGGFTVDFRRVALHELGHFLGLGHENRFPAIMSSMIGNTTQLQADDVAGVSALYGAPPAITNPTPGSKLPGVTATFAWAPNGTAVTEWWLYVGSSPGARNYHDSGPLGGARQTTVGGLPNDGRVVHARLFWRAGASAWSSSDFQFTAAKGPPPTPPSITNPSQAAPLPGASANFAWASNGTFATEWWLYLGSSPGASDYHDSGSLGGATQSLASGLPTDGRPVHARLFWRAGTGAWTSRDFPFTAANLPPPAFASPSQAAPLPGASATFAWTSNGTPASEWWLYLGSSPGASDYHDSGSLGAATQTIVGGLPTDGRLVYARLYWRAGAGSWSSRDVAFTAANLPPPAITSPSQASPLPGATATFAWTANGAPVSEWWLYLGSSPGASDYHDSGSLGAATQTTVGGLPTDGRLVHARLFWRAGGGGWSNSDFPFTAASLPQPTITTPAPGSTLPGPSAFFAWTANGVPATEWWLYVGSSPGASNYHDSGSLGGATQTTVSGLPTDGRVVFARLYWRVGAGAWSQHDFQFTAAPS